MSLWLFAGICNFNKHPLPPLILRKVVHIQTLLSSPQGKSHAQHSRLPSLDVQVGKQTTGTPGGKLQEVHKQIAVATDDVQPWQ